jgi:hypothetical protein
LIQSFRFGEGLPRGRRTPTVVRQRTCGENAWVDERTSWAKRLSEQRKRDAALRYSLEMESRKVGWGDPTLVYAEEKDLFRFTDGRFAFSREHADWGLLRERGA